MLEQPNYQEADESYERAMQHIADYHNRRQLEMRKLAEESEKWIREYNESCRPQWDKGDVTC